MHSQTRPQIVLFMLQTDIVYRQCPVCDSGDAECWLQKSDELTLVQCNDCRMVFANPVATELATGTFYDDRGTSFYLSPQKLESDYSSVRFVRELRLFRRYCQRGAVLDVGCSTGAFLFNLQSRFPGDYDVTGTDVTEAALMYARSKGIRVVQSSFFEIDSTTHQFDAVTFWAVMEHLVTPRIFLSKAAELLRPGGHCFILVPNLRSLAVRVLGSKYRYIMPDHVNYFTPSTLRAFAETVPELQIVGGASTHFNPMVIVKDFRGRNSRVPDAERAALLHRTTRWKQNPALAPARLAYSAIERLLAVSNLADNIAIVLKKRS